MERARNIDPVKANTVCKACGFRPGDSVVMEKLVHTVPNKPPKRIDGLHGRVEDFVAPGRHSTRCHVVRWKETGLVTVLPNVNVKLQADDSK